MPAPARAAVRRPTTHRAALLVTAVALATTAASSALAASGALVWAACAVVAVGLGPVFLTRRGPRPGLARAAGQMVLSLAPVLLLTLVYPLATAGFEGRSVGGAPVATLLLASSLTVPWLSQSVCMPLYRALGELNAGDDARAADDRFCEHWPAALVQSLPVLALFAVPAALVLGLGPAAVGAYLLLCVLHVAFAQSLVVANTPQRRRLWALAWTAYAAALLAAPALWFLPPLAGLVVQLLALRRSLVRVRRPARLEHADVAADLLRGLLLGAVLWGDKFVLFLASGAHLAVQTIFTALLPVVLAYNHYFVRLAPGFDASVARVRTAMEQDTFAVLTERSRALYGTVVGSVVTTGSVAAVLGLLVTAVVAAHDPAALALSATVTIASWFLLMITVLCYKLDYIGRRLPAQALSAVHLLACVVVFTAGTPALEAYAALVVADLAVCAVALALCLRHWRTPEYTLFWRLATSW
ncbi:hypothetical protein [Kineococcus indalonis]|uniref:hypothetical protein n=1 Tax=Kineococcus indalonis TaxID=2696566 RepID=UPI0014124BD7|nr:hypothetical protein [Kineococcus indalonis]NAZ85081.1 hypothetical protein [Kineococcus indalonis]